MIADAERNPEEDRRLRELTDARNQLDSAGYRANAASVNSARPPPPTRKHAPRR